MTRTLVIIPTYNERHSLPDTLTRTRRAAPGADVLVVDDGSPDGTGRWAAERSLADPAVHVLHRPQKAGLGRAYVAGFTWALDRDYDLVVEMDADGSHHPEDLPRLLTAVASGAELAIGSRWIPGGRTVNWPWYRQYLSRGANAYANAAIGLGVHDATAGFRVFTAAILRRIKLTEVNSQGYCFQVDMTRRVRELGGTITEVPITFTERLEGTSKMSRAIVVEALWRTTAWGAERRSRQWRQWWGRATQALRRRS
ncbi:polyprenol monophosphomannose synthase [Ruania halotolerans]|uniref:polyprenol monophosphomannose synthase n=1 Tax=Ruania halotolerans TaxID=2897773 RepID=UPI001E48C215|nr:polyprenol monophosphomannose synthase [Ruania halotolerans]UFU08272.1 polyprenol monophosphomannose synthase [Ruania halotolerans]